VRSAKWFKIITRQFVPASAGGRGVPFPLLVAWAGICTLCSLVASAAAPPEMVFARLGSADGLSQGVITSIVQDVRGFMWFGTEDGLNRFDGYELRHFIHNRADAASLPNNWIAALARDASGRLWVGSDGGGVVWHDDTAGQFRRPEASAGKAQLHASLRVRTLYEDHEGRLWVATRGAGLHELDAHGQEIAEYRHDDANPRSLGDDSVYAVVEDAAGRLWIGTNSGLDRLDPKTGRIDSFNQPFTDAGLPPGAALKVNALYVDSGGTLWIGFDAALARMDVASGMVSVLRHRDGDLNGLPEGRISALLEDEEQRFWVGTAEGLALLDRRSNHFVLVKHDPTNQSSLPDSYITCLYQDRSGLLWVGTKTGGVARWNPRSWSFGHHRFGDAAEDNVTSFAVDRRGTLWVGSFGAGVAAIDPAGTTVRYNRSPQSPLVLGDDVVMAMVTDDHNRVWLGTMNGGIERLDPARHEVVNFLSSATDTATLPSPGVMSLLRDTRGRIWVGTYGGGLAMIDPDSDRVVRYPHGRDDERSLSADRATALAEDRKGLIWIGTDGGGLNVLNPVTGKFAHFLHDPRNPASLSADTVYALRVDDKGSMWVGTRGGGLDQVHGAPFSPAGLNFDNWSEGEGLPNSTVYGIETDGTGRLWVSTNRGIASVSPGDRKVRSFRRNHGLQNDEFNFGAHFRGPTGTLYFGGTNGYNAFLPQQLQFNETPPSVILTGVLKLNLPATATPETLQRLDLGFRDAVVTFQFAALDFTGPAENRYAYRLEGFDHDWVDAGASRQATYTHLDGGDYVFRVRAANNDGRWTDTPLSLPLHVSPPPWATWWARTLYVIVCAALFAGLWIGQDRRMQREIAYAKRLKLEVDERTAELAERNREMEQANQQLREVSVSDSLTGLGNRRRLHDVMAAGIDAPCVLMVIDLDYLKPINDQYGHEGGDALLIQFADILRREFRATDLIVRWGGDEFVVLCRNSDLEGAAELAERVRAAVAKQIFRVGGGRVARTSCTIGFAPVPFIREHPQLLDWQQSLSIADLALYHAKRDRNMWIGWAGTEKAADLPSIHAALAGGPAALVEDGCLIVRRRPWSPEETVDRLRSPRKP
jgi:diguanylate cyclase (GGDEF)-like protein